MNKSMVSLFLTRSVYIVHRLTALREHSTSDSDCSAIEMF